MNHDQMFRIVLLTGLLVLFPIMLVYRIRSQSTRERLDRRQEGLFILATLRPIGVVMLVGVISFLIDPAWMAWSSLRIPAPVRWTGIALGAIAGGLIVWTFHHLGRNLTDTVVTRRAHTLVTAGPYRWVRHPFYDSVALLMLGISLAAANWFLFLIGGVLFWLFVIRTRREEACLLARFGDSYRAYLNRTGRFLPRLSAARASARR